MSKWHLINKEGDQIEVDSSEMNEEKYAGYSVDHSWYKAHGYVEAKEVFRRIEEKYKNITPEKARELLRTGAYKRKPSD